VKSDSFLAFAETCEALSRESGRKKLAALVAAYLGSLGPGDARTASLFLLGTPLETAVRINLGGSILWHAVEDIAPTSRPDYGELTKGAVDVGEAVYGILEAERARGARGARVADENGEASEARGTRANHPHATLTLAEVRAAFQKIAAASGPGSTAVKRRLLADLLAGMSPLEAKWLAKMVTREMRHGVNEGLLIDAVAVLAGTERAEVETKAMFEGSLERLVEGAVAQGETYFKKAGPVLFRPLRPMLAEMAASVEDALEELGGRCVFEYKLDGARVQIHKGLDRVRIFSRALRDLSENLPEIARLLSENIRSASAILDGEVIAISPGGAPLPFQDLSTRLTSKPSSLGLPSEIAASLRLFDVLLADGSAVTERPLEERREKLRSLAAPELIVESLTTGSAEEAANFYQEALAAGHEGLMAKDLASPYRPGARGKHWLKIKKKTTLDLVIVAADYGYGRRHGWLSNYHLAVRDDKGGEFLDVGKTFKGLTDAEFEQMTKRLLALKTSEHGWTVTVRPLTVVEVSFGDIQRSSRYESGYALRFARIERLRDDKRPEDADTLGRLETLFLAQGPKKSEAP